MKKYLLFAASAFVLNIGAAWGDTTNNTYVSVLGGWSEHPALALGTVRNDMDNGYNVGARVGERLDALPGFSIDADYFYNQADYINGATGRLGSSSLMGDLTYHFPTQSPFSFYGGAGLGGVNDSLIGNLHGSSTVFGWQALGGAEYALSSTGAIFAEYRYQNAHGADIGAVHDVGNTSNNLSAGLKFYLR